MPTSYFNQFFLFDLASPSAVGTVFLPSNGEILTGLLTLFPELKTKAVQDIVMTRPVICKREAHSLVC